MHTKQLPKMNAYPTGSYKCENTNKSGALAADPLETKVLQEDLFCRYKKPCQQATKQTEKRQVGGPFKAKTLRKWRQLQEGSFTEALQFPQESLNMNQNFPALINFINVNNLRLFWSFLFSFPAWLL